MHSSASWLRHFTGTLAVAVGCTSSTPPPGVPDSKKESSGLPIKRVERFQHVDLEKPPSPVEEQLQEHFERVFSHAQYSRELTCLARELANFRGLFGGVPDESADIEMRAHCGVIEHSLWTSLVFYSDGTFLDKPISPDDLAAITTELRRALPPFSVFGSCVHGDRTPPARIRTSASA